MTEIELDPNLLVTLQTLESHGVEYVLIGEVAGAIHNGGGFVSSLAIVPGSYGRNVDRLASALKALDAHMSVTDLRATSPCAFKTRYAEIELDFAPGGTNGYSDLFGDASSHRFAPGVNPQVASAPDLDRIEKWDRSPHGAAPSAVAPGVPPPERPYSEDDIFPAKVPASLPPEPDGWPEEIRASRASRASTP